MASYWAKRRRILSKTKETENDILSQFEIQVANQARDESTSVCRETNEDNEECPVDNTIDEEVSQRADSSVSSDSYESDSCESDSCGDIPGWSLNLKLQHWASTFSVPLVAVTALLLILRMYLPNLPKDARTLLGTQSKIAVERLGGGEYYHFGLAKGILSKLSSILHLPNYLRVLKLQFNIDGLPLFKSSKIQFWPILCMIDCDYTKTPFIVGLFCGSGKPSSVWEYLKALVDDLSHLLKNGVTYRGTPLRVIVSSFICDAPARAFVKQVKCHNGYSGCDKCHQVGEWRKKMTYPETTVRLRSDEEFVVMADEGHHLNPSPLTGIVKMVSQFPIDYMHLCCLGVTRKLIQFWLRGKNLTTRQPSKVVSALSDKLINLHPHIPAEFARKPRGLTEIDRWKATELRQFMIYSGPVVLKDILPQELYDNFLLFSVGMSLLLCPNLSDSMIDFAHRMLVAFVNNFDELYGKGEIVFTIHQVIHLADEYRQFGPLDNVSSFPFENFLGKIKRMLRKPHQPLQQVVKRLSEVSGILVQPTGVQPVLLHNHQEGPLPPQFSLAQQYRKVVTKDFCLSTKQGDNCIAIGQEIALVQNILKFSGAVYVIYRKFNNTESYFSYPCPSSYISCYRVYGLHDCFGVGQLENIKRKCVLFPEKESFIAIPLLHQA